MSERGSWDSKFQGRRNGTRTKEVCLRAETQRKVLVVAALREETVSEARQSSLPPSHPSFVTQITLSPRAAPAFIKLIYLRLKRVVKKEGSGNATDLVHLTSFQITV